MVLSTPGSVRPKRAAICLALSLFAGVVAVATPGPRAEAGPASVALGGVNVLFGNKTSMTPVTLDREVVVSLYGLSKLVSLEGRGRSLGFALIGPPVSSGPRPFLSRVRLGFCGSPGCSSGKDEVASFTTFDGDYDLAEGKVTLPKGDYHLYLIADGAPARVVFNLPGLEGRARFRPLGKARFGVTEPEVGVHETATNTIYSNGDVLDMSGEQSYNINALRVESTAWAAGQIAHCIYDQDPPPAPAGFGPGCPGGASVPVTDVLVSPIPGTRIYATAATRSGPGILGHGSWAATAAVVDEVDAVAFHLDFVSLP